MEYLVRLLALHVAVLFALGSGLEPYEEEIQSILSVSLHNYTTLYPHSLTHTIHGSQSQPHHSRLLQFHTLERHFQLYLKPNLRLFSPGFKVQSVDGAGNVREHDINKTDYYRGYMEGEEGSVVGVHISSADPQRVTITAVITTQSETIHVEPSDNFLTKPHPPHMIVYRLSDIKRDRLNGTAGSRFDFVVVPPAPPEVPKEADVVREGGYRGGHQRLKRQSRRIGGSSCPMVLVADFEFFKQFGGGEQDENLAVAGITRRLITLISDVDTAIYRPTKWILNPITDVTVENLGLEIAKVLVHTHETTDNFSSNSTTYYNNPKCCRDIGNDIRKSRDADGILSAFNYGPWDGYCLAHLFTYIDFSSGLLGLANIASSFPSQTGGICSDSFIESGQQQRIIYNTGISSFISGGTPIIRGEQILVVGHEIGHNWGSHHDPSNEPDCAQNFLMNEFAQDDSSPSHRMFSVCSKTSIGQVLNSKAACFRDPDACGDYMIDMATEQCDEGPLGGDCCTSECLLRDGRVCSDTNSPCCLGCQVATATMVCNAAGSLTTNCSTDIFCDGEDLDCPDISTTNMAPPGSSCLLGKCQDIGNNLTKCVDICEFNNAVQCPCPSQDDECKICCRQGNGPCNVSEIKFPTGSPCSRGSCIGGECRAVQDTISRLFSIITDLNVNDLVLFMEENIVGFTIIFSLILWIPASLVLHCCYDRQVWRRFKEDNVDFIHALRSHGDTSELEKPLMSGYDERGELGSRSTSPIDDSAGPPAYSSLIPPPPTGGLETVREEDEEYYDEEEEGGEGEGEGLTTVTTV